jgi:hypothetical protein
MTPATHGNQSSNRDDSCFQDAALPSSSACSARCVPGAMQEGYRGLTASWTRRSALFALGAFLSLLLGCGTGNSFDGGGFPIGKSRLFGRVVAAENPQKSLISVTLNVTIPNTGAGGRTLQVKTGKDGVFDLSSIDGTNQTSNAQVTVTPDDASGRQSQQLIFPLQGGHTANLVVALPLKTFDVNQAVSISLPSQLILPPGSTVQVLAELKNQVGQVLPVVPTLLFEGNFGTVDGEGTFTASAQGTGTITAFWYNNLHSTTQVVVSDNAQPLPPLPPILQRRIGPQDGVQ